MQNYKWPTVRNWKNYLCCSIIFHKKYSNVFPVFQKDPKKLSQNDSILEVAVMGRNRCMNIYEFGECLLAVHAKFVFKIIMSLSFMYSL